MRAKKALTHAERQNRANAKASAAVSIFELAVVSLEEAAKEQTTLAVDVAAEIERLQVVLDKAHADADSAHEVADKIRGLLA